MEILKKKPTNGVHAYIPELEDLFRKGRISRREFLRNATLLGMSLASASAFLAACAPKPEPTATPKPVKAAPTATRVPGLHCLVSVAQNHETNQPVVQATQHLC